MTFMGPLKRVTTQVGLEKGLGLKSTSATQAIQILALTRTLNSLNPKFASLQATFSPHMPLTHHISISVQALTPKLHPFPLLALMSCLVTLTTPTH